ncbi:hypothetical protein [Arthrobacter sp. NPDC057009]|uniref:hypothetical protein n=1 Tax=Arthrobacter sp. NPDC057009 TaxID=3345996 RepID=UPI00362B3FB8
MYLERNDPDGTFQQRITCDNSAAEFHPVVSPDGTALAYASDARGNLDIWLVRLAEDLKDCPQAQQLTVSDADDAWPTWAADSSSVIFSSGRKDPLGDLFQLPVPEPGGASEANLIQLTAGPDADTQPAAYRQVDIDSGSGPTWVAFTTTRYNRGGSLAALQITSGAAAMPKVFPLWPTDTEADSGRAPGFGSSEPAWSPAGDRIAFTSRRDDPSGDVLIAQLVFADNSFEIDPSRIVRAAADAGTAESHAAWLSSDPVSTFIAYTARTPKADISDAAAFDGSARRVVAAATLDNAGPAYSPDGTALLWSHELGTGTGWELVRGRADGSDASPLNYERGERDVDRDPVWSPDGRRIAFTRYSWTGDGYSDPATWILDLGAERPDGAPAPSRQVSNKAPADVRYWEEDPNWSPDGSFLAVTRTYAPNLKVELEAPKSAHAGEEIVVAATITNVGHATTDSANIVLELPEGLAVTGARAPCSNASRVVTCPVGPLAPGDSSVQKWTLRSTVVGNKKIVVRLGLPGDSDLTNNTAEAVIEIDAGDLQIKLVPEKTATQLGELARLTGSVANLGPGRTAASAVTFSPSSGLTITDWTGQCSPHGDDITCVFPALNSQDVPREWTVTVRADAPGKKTVTGKVPSAAGETVLENNTAETVIETDAGDLQIELRPEQATLYPGESVSLTGSVSNLGPGRTAASAVTFSPSSGLTITDWTGQCSPRGADITCAFPALTSQDAPREWTLTVHADVAGKQTVTGKVPSAAGEVILQNNAAEIAIVIDVGDLQIELLPEKTSTYRGESVNLTGSVSNRGPGRTAASTVMFSPSSGLTITDWTGQCSPSGADITCTFPALTSQDPPREWTLTVRADAWGMQTVAGNVSTTPGETVLKNNKAVVTVDVPEQIIEGPGPSQSQVPPSTPPSEPPPIISVRPVSSPGTAQNAPVGAINAQPTGALPARIEPLTARPELWVLNATTGEANPVNAPERCTAACAIIGAHPAWSPDGTRIVVTDRGMLQAVVLKDDDKAGGPDVPHAAASITALTGFDPAGKPTANRAAVSSAVDPAWSPDGSEIYFAGQPTGQPDHQGIYAVDRDGRKLRKVVQDRGPETQPAIQPWADLEVRLATNPDNISTGSTATLKATAVNKGPSPAASVKILMETPDGLTALSTTKEGCDVTTRSVQCTLDGSLSKGAETNIEVQVKGDAEGEHISTATVTSDTPEPLTSDNQAKTSTRVRGVDTPEPSSSDIAVELTLDQSEGWNGGRPATGKAKVTNNGPAAVADISIKVSTTGSLTLQPGNECRDGECSLGSLDSGGSREVDLTFNMPPSEPTGRVSARQEEISVEASTSSADPKPDNNTARAGFTVHQPGVTIYPAVAKPGDVVTVIVEGLPPAAAARLAWSKGIPPDSTKIEHDGTELRRGLLVVRRDQLGTREIIVTSADAEALFGEIRGPVLIVARPVAPMPDFIGRG